MRESEISLPAAGQFFNSLVNTLSYIVINSPRVISEQQCENSQQKC